jgi:2-dehydropantoate 2-reductase
MTVMKILIYGAGPLGSLFAVRLLEAGHDVSVLARGQRLQELRTYGVVLEDSSTGMQEAAQVHVVEALDPDDRYDLILVVMRKNHALQILPVLAANRHSATILFMMNNAAGQDELIEALGHERVMVGFPLPGGERKGHIMRVLPVNEEKRYTLPIGEVDGRITERTHTVAAVLGSMRGYDVQIRTDMDAWLKYHVAVVMPLAQALYATGGDIERLGRTRDARVLGVRGVREAFAALRQAGVPVSPAELSVLNWLPEPSLVGIFQWATTTHELKVSGEGHALAARDEMQHLTDEFIALAKAAGAKTPTLERLYTYFDPATPPMPDGSRQIPMQWKAIWIIGLAKLSFLLLLIYLLIRRSSGEQAETDAKAKAKAKMYERASRV